MTSLGIACPALGIDKTELEDFILFRFRNKFANKFDHLVNYGDGIVRLHQQRNQLRATKLPAPTINCIIFDTVSSIKRLS